MSISRKDIDQFEPIVERAVQKLLGKADSNVIDTAVNCAVKGYDRRKMRDKLESMLDSDMAYKFSDKLISLIDTFNDSSRRSRKRKEDREDTKEAKKSRKSEPQPPSIPPPTRNPLVPDPSTPSPGQLTHDKIKDMMANAQRMIQERKVQLVGSMPPPSTVAAMSTVHGQMEEKAKRAADLQARIQAQLMNTGIAPAGLVIAKPAATATPAAKPAAPASKPQPVILDEMGRTIDASTGEAIEVPHYTPTLKANIRAKRREQFKSVLQDQKPDDVVEAKFFDPRVGQKTATRTKRQFRFHEAGKFQQMGQRMRTKAQLEKLQDEIAQAAKKTGIASAAKLATIQPKKEVKAGEIPVVEWWDSVIMKVASYDDLPMLDDDTLAPQAVEGVTHLVEHPAQMKPPTEKEADTVIPIMLTAKERKKLRRQTRNEAQKDQQEKVRLGLMPPPEPKVRMANLMRVLGTEAVQDPTKVEAHVRAQMAKRQRAHEEANAARKLTPEQRREKKINKIKEDTTQGVNVTLYRVKSLNNPSKKFKIEANSKQLYMTGFVVLCKDCNIVVVEGGPKQQKKFKRLMMHRLKWEEEPLVKGDDSGEKNRCDVVWEGMVKERAFTEIQFKACPTEKFAREQFRKHNVEHYWDLAFSGAVLEASDA